MTLISSVTFAFCTVTVATTPEPQTSPKLHNATWHAHLSKCNYLCPRHAHIIVIGLFSTTDSSCMFLLYFFAAVLTNLHSVCWPVGGESAVCKKNSIYRWIYKKNVFCFPWFPLASLLWMQMETLFFLLLIYFYICYYTSLKSAWSLLLGELVRLVHCNVNSLCISPHGQKHRHAHGRPQGPLCNVATT